MADTSKGTQRNLRDDWDSVRNVAITPELATILLELAELDKNEPVSALDPVIRGVHSRLRAELMRPGKADRREGNKGKGRDDSAQVAAGVQWTRVLIGVYRENVEGWRSNDIPGKLSKQENTVQYVVKLVSGRVKKGLPVLRNRGELESTVADLFVPPVVGGWSVNADLVKVESIAWQSPAAAAQPSPDPLPVAPIAGSSSGSARRNLLSSFLTVKEDTRSGAATSTSLQKVGTSTRQSLSSSGGQREEIIVAPSGGPARAAQGEADRKREKGKSSNGTIAQVAQPSIRDSPKAKTKVSIVEPLVISSSPETTPVKSTAFKKERVLIDLVSPKQSRNVKHTGKRRRTSSKSRQETSDSEDDPATSDLEFVASDSESPDPDSGEDEDFFSRPAAPRQRDLYRSSLDRLRAARSKKAKTN